MTEARRSHNDKDSSGKMRQDLTVSHNRAESAAVDLSRVSLNPTEQRAVRVAVQIGAALAAEGHQASAASSVSIRRAP